MTRASLANQATRGVYERLVVVLPPLAHTAAETVVVQASSPLVEPLIEHIQVQDLARCDVRRGFSATLGLENIDLARASSVKILPMCTKRIRSVRGTLVRAPRADRMVQR